MSKYTILTLFCGMLVSACAPVKQREPASSDMPAIGTETEYCSSPISYTNPAVVSGFAKYNAWLVTAGGLTTVTSAPLDIPHAEILITDNAGAIIQCGETNADGSFSLNIPKTSGPFKLQVNSRAFNNYLKVSVLNNPTAKSVYSLEQTINSDGVSSSYNLGTLVAPHNETILGGAFNILRQAYLANEYLRNNTTCTGCTTFSVAPKAIIYWTPGLTPASYLGYPNSGISFFDAGGGITSEKALYILGGIGGNTNSTDTDHFDNSVIIHEYGHFLEDAFSRSESPGGSHDGNFIIDPRLAFSEGFANFFAGAVAGTPFYYDTEGNASGTTKLRIALPLETDIVAGKTYDRIVHTSPVGEGVFREMSVARALWDFIDGANDSETSNLNFGYLWEALVNSTVGFKSNNMNFRSMGHFNEALLSIFSSLGVGAGEVSAASAIITNESQTTNRNQYGLKLTATGGNCPRQIVPSANLLDPFTGSEVSNIFRSHDFFEFYHAGGDPQLSLVYTQLSSPDSDLDLILYNKNHVLGDTNYIAAYSARSRSLGDADRESPLGTESIANINLPAGVYLIDVQVYTFSGPIGAGAEYYIRQNGVNLCP